MWYIVAHMNYELRLLEQPMEFENSPLIANILILLFNVIPTPNPLVYIEQLGATLYDSSHKPTNSNDLTEPAYVVDDNNLVIGILSPIINEIRL